MKRILVILTTPPYGSSNAQDGLDFAVAGVNFGHEMQVLFEADGVWQLHPDQAPPKGTKNVYKRITALPLFDIEECYACQHSLTERLGETPLPDDVRAISPQAKAQLLDAADMVVRF